MKFRGGNLNIMNLEIITAPGPTASSILIFKNCFAVSEVCEWEATL